MKIWEQLRGWLKKPHHTLTDTERKLRWCYDLARHGVSELRRNRAQQMAAALTYRTLFSLLPTIVLMMTVLASFVSQEERESFKKSLVNWTLSPITQGELPVASSSDSVRRLPDAVPETTEQALERRQEFEDVRRNLTLRIEEIIDSLEDVNFRSISLVGILLFIYGATGLLGTIEGSFNTVYGAVQGRSPLVQLPIHYTVITLGPLVILIGQILRRSFLGALEAGQWTNWLIGLLAFLTPFLAAWFFLWLLYMLIPNTRVSLRMTVVGSFVSATLLVVGNRLFSIYVQKAAFSTLYGALGLFPLFLFWIWVMWLIVLFGLVLSYTLQSMREGKFRHSLTRSSDEMVLDPTLVLPVATCIAEGFAHGNEVTVSDVSRALQLPEHSVAHLAAALRDAGLIYEIKGRRSTGYALTQPAEAIRASDVLAAGDSLLASNLESHSSPAWDFLGRLKGRVQDEAAHTTLADLSSPQPGEA